MRSMEAVAVAASQQEPVLLVGETGTGKTTLVQHLAEQVGLTARWYKFCDECVRACKCYSMLPPGCLHEDPLSGVGHHSMGKMENACCGEVCFVCVS